MLIHNALRQSLKSAASVSTTSTKQVAVLNAFRLFHYSLPTNKNKD